MDPLQLIAEADKKAKPSSGLFSIFGGSSSYRFEEAAELYAEAANQYKFQKNLSQAGKLYEKAAEYYLKAESTDFAGTSLVDAYKAYKTVSPADAARCLSRAVEYLTLKGRFRSAANSQFDLAELYLQLNEKDNAIKAFDQAGDWYLADSAESLSNKSFLRSADLKAELGQYVEASQTYESIAEKAVNNAVSKWSVKDYFFKLILCRLAASDYAGGVNKLDLFLSWDRSFLNTKEYRFLSLLLDGVKERDPDAIGKSAAEFDQFRRLDNWSINLLTKIKDSLGGSSALGAGGDMDEDDLT